MIESYQEGRKLSRNKANKRAKEIAISCYGEKNWKQGGWPTNLGNKIDINNLNNLYNALVAYGPVYALYSNDESAHLIVVTGVNLTDGIIYTNNPWGVRGKQSYNEFINGFSKKIWQGGKEMQFQCIYTIKY